MLAVVPSPLILHERVPLANLVLKYRLPAIFALHDNAEAGGLMSYGADLHDLYRRAAGYAYVGLRPFAAGAQKDNRLRTVGALYLGAEGAYHRVWAAFTGGDARTGVGSRWEYHP